MSFDTSLSLQASLSVTLREALSGHRAQGLVGGWRTLLTSSNKKLLGTSATLLVTGALLVVTRSY